MCSLSIIQAVLLGHLRRFWTSTRYEIVRSVRHATLIKMDDVTRTDLSPDQEIGEGFTAMLTSRRCQPTRIHLLHNLLPTGYVGWNHECSCSQPCLIHYGLVALARFLVYSDDRSSLWLCRSDEDKQGSSIIVIIKYTPILFLLLLMDKNSSFTDSCLAYCYYCSPGGCQSCDKQNYQKIHCQGKTHGILVQVYDQPLPSGSYCQTTCPYNQKRFCGSCFNCQCLSFHYSLGIQNLSTTEFGGGYGS